MVSSTTNHIELKWDPPLLTSFSIHKYTLSIEALANTFDYTYSVELPGEKEKFTFSNLPGNLDSMTNPLQSYDKSFSFFSIVSCLLK